MGREGRLSELTEREKDNVILVLAGAVKDLRSRFEEVSMVSRIARSELLAWQEQFGRKLGFLEKTYSRTVIASRENARTAANDTGRVKSTAIR